MEEQNETRSKTLQVRITPTEKEQFEALAKWLGVKPSDLLYGLVSMQLAPFIAGQEFEANRGGS